VKPEEEPKSWRDLLDPKWSGKMLADDTRALGAGGIFFSVMTEWFGADFHRRLAQQKIVFGRDLGADQLRIARGEFPLRWPQSLSNMRDLKGLPLRFIIPTEGLTYVRVDSAIIKGAARPNAAQLFIAYMLSQKTQDVLAGFGLIPVIKGVVNAPDAETRDLVSRAKEKLLGTSHPDTIEAMLALAKEIYK
jgi:iron(III) transport system substrate-binding protein